MTLGGGEFDVPQLALFRDQFSRRIDVAGHENSKRHL
jgi:hypothetical protein